LEEAIRSAIGDVHSVGFDVVRVELQPSGEDMVISPAETRG
jgi:virulence-associated protein VagC